MKVFIHTNNKQLFGAYISKYSILKNNIDLKSNDIEIINVDSNNFFESKNDRTIIRGGKKFIWKKNDLQSFTLLRFFPPSLMNYDGFSMVIDPDIFSANNFTKLYNQFDKNIPIMAKINNEKNISTSLMIFNNKLCEKLQLIDKVNEVLNGKMDYNELMNLNFIENNDFQPLTEKWNSYDNLEEDTIFLHTTKRITQPWKTGLKVDFHQDYPRFKYKIIPYILIKYAKDIIKGNKNPPFTKYLDHPNDKIQKFFFQLVSSALKDGFIDKKFIDYNIKNLFVRKDIYNKLSL